MRTSSCKAKGRRCSQEVKDLLLGYAPWVHESDITVTPSGVTGPDLTFSHAAAEAYPFAVECKNVEKLNIWEALKQAESHEGGTPVLFFKRNRSVVYVALRADTFLEMIK